MLRVSAALLHGCAQVMRQVRDGYDGRRGASGSARGQLRMTQLVGADKGSRPEAARLGILNSDEEMSDDDGKDKDDVDADDELGVEEMLTRSLKERHMGSLGKSDFLGDISSSESEDEADAADEQGAPSEGEERRERGGALAATYAYPILVGHR